MQIGTRPWIIYRLETVKIYFLKLDTSCFTLINAGDFWQFPVCIVYNPFNRLKVRIIFKNQPVNVFLILEIKALPLW